MLFVALFAFQAIRVLFHDRWRELLLKLRRGHIVICRPGLQLDFLFRLTTASVVVLAGSDCRAGKRELREEEE